MFWSIVAFISCIVLFWIRWRKKRLDIFKKHGIPGPEHRFITGNLKEFDEKKDTCIEEWLHKYGSIFGFFLGGKPYIVCSDVEFLKIMEMKDLKNFSGKDFILPDAGIPHKQASECIGLLKDEKWKKARNIISTAFSSGKIKLLSTLMNEPINIFLKKINSQKEEPFNIFQFLKELTFDIICKTEFGITTNVQEKETSKFIRSVYSLFHINASDPLVALSIIFPEFEPLPTYLRRLVDIIKNIMNLTCAGVIFDTCRKIIDSRKNAKSQYLDLLQIMLDAESDSNGEMKVPADFIIANTVLFLLVGYDTTSISVGWCTYYLVNNPEAQERVRREIYENIPNGAEIQYSDLNKLQFLDQVISESLRLSPLSITIVNRISDVNFKYKNMTIPKGVPILAAIPILQKDPNYWQDPEKFDPDRFSRENRSKINPTTYQPFGAGPRSCVGIRLAQCIMKLILANLFRSYHLENYGEKPEMENGLLMNQPKNGIVVRATRIS